MKFIVTVRLQAQKAESLLRLRRNDYSREITAFWFHLNATKIFTYSTIPRKFYPNTIRVRIES